MDEMHELVEDEYILKARYSVINSYLQATSLFLKEILYALNGSYMPWWSPKLEEALILRTTHFVFVDDYIVKAWELKSETQEILQTLNKESQIEYGIV